MRFLRLLPSEARAAWGPALARLERGTSYPLGDDRFEIDHGPDYFAFFDRLGAAACCLAIDGPGRSGEVAAVAFGVLRHVPGPGGARLPAWYLCDFKVRPPWRGQHLPLRMVAHNFLWGWRQAPRGYAVAMLPPSGEPPAARLFARFPAVSGGIAATLGLWTFDAPTTHRLLPLLTAHRGVVRFLSHQGRKDILLASTGARMPLLHAQWGPLAAPPGPDTFDAPQPGHLHMLCAPQGSALFDALSAAAGPPGAAARVLAARMPSGGDGAWEWLLTSDI